MAAEGYREEAGRGARPGRGGVEGPGGQPPRGGRLWRGVGFTPGRGGRPSRSSAIPTLALRPQEGIYLGCIRETPLAPTQETDEGFLNHRSVDENDDLSSGPDR